MEDISLIPVNITIADRSYRLRINKGDEETVRQTVKQINEKIIDYKTNFSGKDMQDYVSMVLLWFATEQKKPSTVQTASEENLQKLKKIEQQLNKVIS